MRLVLLPAIFVLSFTSTAFSKSHHSSASASTFKAVIKESKLTYLDEMLLTQEVNVGEIIATAERLVAFGENFYTLIQKGKPNSQIAKAAPISVVPRDPITKAPVDIWELEGDAPKVRKKFFVALVNGLNKEVARLDILIQFDPKKSYNGVGQYIQNAVVIPTKVNAGYGWDIAATMELTSIGFKGKKTNPIAMATLTVNYTMKSVFNSTNQTMVIDLDGAGNVEITQ